jgi:hypothetical protein
MDASVKGQDIEVGRLEGAGSVSGTGQHAIAHKERLTEKRIDYSTLSEFPSSASIIFGWF